MTRAIQLHPFSVVLGAITVASAGLLAGGGGPASPLDFMTVVQIDDGFGNMIDTVRFTGCNVQIVNGLDDTETVNGAGNLIVGYNEVDEVPPLIPPDRTGSHNLVGGSQNNYSGHGGLVVGQLNTISGEYVSVSGGRENTANGDHSSVSGGRSNVASGECSSVSGGGGVVQFKNGISIGNTASGPYSSVSGGSNNVACGQGSSVSGGGGFAGPFAPLQGNVASAAWSSVSGGAANHASGSRSSVSGGSFNVASEFLSSISGGDANAAIGLLSSISGGCNLIADQECQHLPCNQCPTDANGDGVVDVDDLLQVILTWGMVCP